MQLLCISCLHVLLNSASRIIVLFHRPPQPSTWSVLETHSTSRKQINNPCVVWLINANQGLWWIFTQVMEADLDKMWDSIAKPPQYTDSKLRDFFNVSTCRSLAGSQSCKRVLVIFWLVGVVSHSACLKVAESMLEAGCPGLFPRNRVWRQIWRENMPIRCCLGPGTTRFFKTSRCAAFSWKW